MLLIAWAATTVVLLLAYPERYAGYDASWAAIWGRQIADGAQPSVDAPFAPTSHPLSNAVAAVYGLVGDHFADAAPVVGLAALAAGAVLLGAAGWRLFGPVAGLVAGGVVATRPSLLPPAAHGSTDPWFVALVAGAFLVTTGRRDRPAAVLGLLAVAGLLRPEAWALSAAYVVACGRGAPGTWWRLVALAASAPVVWMTVDLVTTGDPLFALHTTSALAEQLDRPRTQADALSGLPSALRALLGDVPLALGLVGAPVAAVVLYERAVVPLAACATGFVVFVVLGVLGLPVLDRYLLVPAMGLAVFAGVAVGGWTRLGSDAGPRAAWSVASLLAVALLVASIPGDARDVRRAVALTGARARVQDDLRTALRDPAARATVQACPAVVVPDYRAIPEVLAQLPVTPTQVRTGAPGRGFRGLVLSYSSDAALRAFGVAASQPLLARDARPAGTRIRTSPSWDTDAFCPPGRRRGR